MQNQITLYVAKTVILVFDVLFLFLVATRLAPILQPYIPDGDLYLFGPFTGNFAGGFVLSTLLFLLYVATIIFWIYHRSPEGQQRRRQDPAHLIFIITYALTFLSLVFMALEFLAAFESFMENNGDVWEELLTSDIIMHTVLAVGLTGAHVILAAATAFAFYHTAVGLASMIMGGGIKGEEGYEGEYPVEPDQKVLEDLSEDKDWEDRNQ